MELLVSTRSQDKMVEIRRILGDVAGLKVIDLDSAGIPESDDEEGIEIYDTFEENARAKAEYFYAKVGIPTVADDSGLEVDALGGAPGVRSKRFAPDRGLKGKALDGANNDHLVERLGDLEPAKRTGRYVCAAVLVGLDQDPITIRGEAEGLILSEPQGHGGFGYDPLFVPDAHELSFAELGREVKNFISHRAQALAKLAEYFR